MPYVCNIYYSNNFKIVFTHQYPNLKMIDEHLLFSVYGIGASPLLVLSVLCTRSM